MNDTQNQTPNPAQADRAAEIVALLEQLDGDKLQIVHDYMQLTLLASDPDAPEYFLEDYNYLKSWLDGCIETHTGFSWREFAAMIRFIKTKLHEVSEYEAAEQATADGEA